MNVEAAMSTMIATCSLEDRLTAAVRSMGLLRHWFLPVLDDGLVVGVITGNDIVAVLAADLEALASTNVASVMSRDVAICQSNERVELAMQLMQRRRVRRLPVVNGQCELVGILSLVDLDRMAGSLEPSELRDLEATEALVWASAVGARSRATACWDLS